jgi:prephenate dehydratase
VTTYGYLGPEGTFAEAALLSSLGAPEGVAALPADVELRAYAGVAAAIAGVRDGEVLASMVPVENSVEGAVAQTLDELASGAPLTVIGEAVLPVTFSLVAAPGTTLEDVRRVGTHPHAEAQTRQWFATNLPGVAVTSTTSTAAAAAALADGTAHWDAAICAPFAASVYGLAVLAEGVGDNPSAETRFVLVSGPTTPPSASGADKTSLVLYIGKDHPGALLEILTEFAVRGINLTRIESRPTGGGIGDYFFSIDAEGHIDDQRVGEALMGLRRVCAEVRFLGSFPRVDGVRPTLRRGVSDAEYHEAQAWLSRVREGRG